MTDQFIVSVILNPELKVLNLSLQFLNFSKETKDLVVFSVILVNKFV